MKHVLGWDDYEALVQPTNNAKKFSWKNHGTTYIVTVHVDAMQPVAAKNKKVFTEYSNGWKNALGESTYNGKTVVYAEKCFITRKQELWLEGNKGGESDCSIDLELKFTPKKRLHCIRQTRSVKRRSDGLRTVSLDLHLDSTIIKRGGSQQISGDGHLICSETLRGKKVKGVKEFKKLN